MGYIFTRAHILYMAFPNRMGEIVTPDFRAYDLHHTKFAQNCVVVVIS